MNPKNNATSQSPKSPTSLPCAILRLCVSARNFLHEHCAQPGRTVDGRKRIWRLSTWKPVERYFAAEKQLDELAVAIRFYDTSRMRAWLDQFSSPGERYAALRALAEPRGGYCGGAEPDLVRWATDQIEGALGLDECALAVADTASVA